MTSTFAAEFHADVGIRGVLQRWDGGEGTSNPLEIRKGKSETKPIGWGKLFELGGFAYLGCLGFQDHRWDKKEVGWLFNGRYEAVCSFKTVMKKCRTLLEIGKGNEWTQPTCQGKYGAWKSLFS